MFKTLRTFFSPPVYEDLETNRQARFITYILYVVFGIDLLALLAAPFGITETERVVAFGIFLLITGIIVRQLLYTGKVNAAGVLLNMVVWGMLTLTHVINGGIHSLSLVIHVPIVLIASLTLSAWGRWAYILSSTAAMGQKLRHQTRGPRSG